MYVGVLYFFYEYWFAHSSNDAIDLPLALINDDIAVGGV